MTVALLRSDPNHFLAFGFGAFFSAVLPARALFFGAASGSVLRSAQVTPSLKLSTWTMICTSNYSKQKDPAGIHKTMKSHIF